MRVKLTDSLKAKIFAALITAGVAAPVAYIASTHTIESEGFLTHLHLDPVGLRTVCVGHLVKRGEQVKQEYTIDECVDMYVQDWISHTNQLKSVVKVPFRSQWMEGALIDFTFNKGIGNVESSTLLRRLNSNQYDLACDQLTRWVYGRVNGEKVVLKGLQIRATAQFKYCMGEEPSSYKIDMERWGYEVVEDS